MKTQLSRNFFYATVFAVLVFAASPAMAASIAGLPISTSSGPLPWDRVLGVVVSALTGTTAKALAVIAFAVCGVGLLYGEGGGGTRKLLGIGLGISLIVGAGSLVQMFFSSGSGLAI
jgi:type IV secretory pathway VirB2 component (pilin)